MNTFDPKHRYSDAAKLARLKNKKLFLFDIDGTIAVGDTLYEGSADLIRYINAIGGRAYYITNNSTKSGLDYVKKFHDTFHLDSTEDQFITSGYMTLRFLKENYAGKQDFLDKVGISVLYFLLVINQIQKAMTKRSTHFPLPERAAACMRWKAASRQECGR